jgi:lactate dehydrogenase-like 2-hydroxyacid dehydrogenase
MAVNFILIDYENIQPDADALQRLEKGDLKILIFAKAKDKLTFDRAMALQPFGKRVEYIPTRATGSNALDFHIAFQLGVLACESPGATANVISKATG